MRILRAAVVRVESLSPDQCTRKAHQDYVTNVDLEIDAFLVTALSELLPGCPVLSEERAVRQGDAQELYWIIDPIDGTLNLMAGLPFYGISVALVDSAGPRIAAVAAVAQGEIYAACRGMGAWKDHRPLRLGAQAARPLLVLSTGLIDRLVLQHDAAYTTLRRYGKIRNLGSQALHLCGVAEGRFIAAISIEARIWDEAAAGLILREAGGIWHSRADRMDWRIPAELMAVTEQRSLASHPDHFAELAEILAPVFAEG